MYSAPIEAVIFDCDGVLVDSEEACCLLCAQDAREVGMPVADEDAVLTFSGMALPMIQQKIERHSGVTLGPHWVKNMQARFIEAMKKGVKPMVGVEAMLEAIQALGVPMHVASNSSQDELRVKLTLTGLEKYFTGRIHSARDMRAPKPKPDVYLHAAAVQGVDPSHCLVLEDSDLGAKAAIDAGMTCALFRQANKPIPQWQKLFRVEKLSDFSKLVAKMVKK